LGENCSINCCFQEEATESQNKFDSEKQKMTGETAQMLRSLEKEKGVVIYFLLICWRSLLTLCLFLIVIDNFD